MFILTNIKIITSQQLFNVFSTKYIKFQIQHGTTKSPFPAKIVNYHQIRWDTPLKFKEANYNGIIPFEVYEPHQFGCHNEEISSILYGSIQINKQQTYFNCSIFIQRDNSIIGTLTCNVRHQEELTNTVILKKTAQPQILTIKSIVAHIPSTVNKRILIKVRVAEVQIGTSPIKSISGDLVFAEVLILNKYDTVIQGTISIFQMSGQSEIKIGEGKISLAHAKPDKKVILRDLNNEVIGEAYVDSFQESREKTVKSLSVPIHLHKLSPGKYNMDQTAFSKFSNMTKKISVISSNQSIPFPTEKRFKETAHNPESFYQTRSSRCSKKSIGMYRAMKIFKPSKELFSISEQQTPGVGKYKLPTIWDRY